MRLADPAVTLACVSLIFGLLLVVFPVSFPRMIVQNWQNARLTPIMILFTVSLNLGLYLGVAHQRSSRPGILASACLGSVPVFLLAGLNFLLQATIAHTLSLDIPNAFARVDEEIIAHTYFALIASMFGPFLLIRLGQQFRNTNP
jgi:protein-S-isoprenylcysteine O-methyltransferase Ste14